MSSNIMIDNSKKQNMVNLFHHVNSLFKACGKYTSHLQPTAKGNTNIEQECYKLGWQKWLHGQWPDGGLHGLSACHRHNGPAEVLMVRPLDVTLPALTHLLIGILNTMTLFWFYVVFNCGLQFVFATAVCPNRHGTCTWVG